MEIKKGIDIIKIEDVNKSFKNITFLGKRGFGKSDLAKKLIAKQIKLQNQSIIILDITNEYEFNNSFVFYSLSDFLHHLAKHGITTGKIYILKFSRIQEYNELIEVVNSSITDVLLVLEEVQNISSSKYISEPLNEIASLGRHKRISYFAIARRPTEINNYIMAQSDFIITTRQIIENDIKKIQSFSPQFEPEQLRSLQIGEYFFIPV